MKTRSLTLALSALLLLLASCNGQQQTSSFITTDNTRLIKHGNTYNFIGCNIWYASILGSTGTGGNRERLCRELDQLKALDFNKLKSNKQWEEATEKVQTIQQEWRTIGFAPKKQNQAVYNEYRELCEAFFKAKTAYYKGMRDEFSENLKKKRELVEAAEALKESIEWTETTNKLIELQQQWKKVGPVARKYSDDLWKKFTAACDAFFEAKREATKELREQYAQKRAEAKERWNKKVDGMNDRQKLIRMYENLVQEIKTAENNILFFTGKSKTANKLVDDMRKKIDTLKSQLNDLENKINQMDAE